MSFKVIARLVEFGKKRSLSSKIPLLEVTDSWRKISDVTGTQCVHVVGAFKKELYNPAKWMYRMAYDFRIISMCTDFKYTRTIREDAIDTLYFWQKEMNIISQEDLNSATEDQKRAIQNIEVIKLKTIEDLK